jgi:hypothetical protein
MNRLAGPIAVDVVTGSALIRAERSLDQLRLLVMVMKVDDKLVEVQLGKRPRRIGGLRNRLQRVVGRHGFCDHRKKIVDLLGRGVGEPGGST